MSKLTPVRFTARAIVGNSIYHAGQIAGFDEATVDRLLDSEVAVEYDAKDDEKPATKDKPKQGDAADDEAEKPKAGRKRRGYQTTDVNPDEVKSGDDG